MYQESSGLRSPIKSLLGHWFWEDYRARRVISLDDLIAGSQNAAYWVDTKEILGSNCCAVSRDINVPGEYRLRQGIYVYYEALLADKPVPSLETLLTQDDKTELAHIFRNPYIENILRCISSRAWRHKNSD
jgi:hypothetical protein